MRKIQKRIRLASTSCPSCSEMGGLKKIIFGMPSSDFDQGRFISGGCLVSEEDPEIGCVECGWEGMQSECL